MLANRVRSGVAALSGALAMAMEGKVQAQTRDEFDTQRHRMLEEIVAMARDMRNDPGRTALAAPVLAAMAKVPRHEFVPAASRASAYANRPLPIGAGQTISQPFIVALMSDLMRIKPGDKVLEVGTGSGYQAAVLAEMGAAVHTIEIVESLAQEAQARLRRLGYLQILTRTGDGYQGWPEQAPFDAIMLTAAPLEVPQPLIDQLRAGGRLVAPVGRRDGVQSLLLIEKNADGTHSRRNVLAVRFVPLIDDSGKQR
jgi:protein-L-isoaspartate(D-aspartate) O-methyltransferase